jgi:hypothetical protein
MPEDTEKRFDVGERFDVVGIRSDGTRELVRAALTADAVDLCRGELEKTARYLCVISEPTGWGGDRPPVYRLLARQTNGQWLVVHEALPLAIAEREEDRLLKAGHFTQTMIQSARLRDTQPLHRRD